MTRCNRTAHHYALNGYRVCGQCLGQEKDKAAFAPLPKGCRKGKCDRPVDGMGAACWSKRMAAAERMGEHD
jgi:hypothetical protein